MTVKIDWRNYQLECVETIIKNFKETKKQYIQLPTGAGKTFIFLKYLKENSQKAVVIVPSKELREQVLYNGKYIFKLSISDNIDKQADVYVFTAACLNFDRSFDFIYGFEPDTIIIDEAHHAQCKTYKEFLKDLDFSYNLLGFTATPERMDGKSLNEIFEKQTYEKSVLALIEEGHLCDVEAFRFKSEIEAKSVRSGDFSSIELKMLDIDKRNELILKVYQDHCTQKKTIIFCLSISHSEKMAYLLKKMGYNACAIHGKMNMKERARILHDYKTGKIQVLTNCQLLTEGFDEPSIEAILIARPTKSKALYCQMVGRGLRNFPGKKICSLYEVADNNHRLCNFTALAGKNAGFDYDYEQGERLSTLKEKIYHLTTEDIFLKKESFNLFEELDSKKDLFDMPAFKSQIQELYNLDIGYMHPISFYEAAFLLWKDKKMRQYGIDRE